MGQDASREKSSNDIKIVQIGHEVRKIWQKKLGDLPLSKDLPRLAKNITIIDQDGHHIAAYPREILYEDEHNYQQPNHVVSPLLNGAPASGEEQTAVQKRTSRAIYTILTSTAKAVDPSAVDILTYEAFNSQVHVGHYSTLNTFMTNFFGEDSKTTLILKACNQSIVAPAITQMKTALHGKLEYKDVHGGWKIIINLHNTLSVTHIRREQVVVDDGYSLRNSFQFEWTLKIEFLPDVSDIHEISLKLTDIKAINHSMDSPTTSSSAAQTNFESSPLLMAKENISEPDRDEQARLEHILRSIVYDVSITDLEINHTSGSSLPDDGLPPMHSGSKNVADLSSAGREKQKLSGLKRISQAAKRLSVMPMFDRRKSVAVQGKN